jgi:hypothetical protein
MDDGVVYDRSVCDRCLAQGWVPLEHIAKVGHKGNTGALGLLEDMTCSSANQEDRRGVRGRRRSEEEWGQGDRTQILELDERDSVNIHKNVDDEGRLTENDPPCHIGV